MCIYFIPVHNSYGNLIFLLTDNATKYRMLPAHTCCPRLLHLAELLLTAYASPMLCRGVGSAPYRAPCRLFKPHLGKALIRQSGSPDEWTALARRNLYVTDF